jgi:hypothetical protein
MKKKKKKKKKPRTQERTMKTGILLSTCAVAMLFALCVVANNDMTNPHLEFVFVFRDPNESGVMVASRALAHATMGQEALQWRDIPVEGDSTVSFGARLYNVTLVWQAETSDGFVLHGTSTGQLSTLGTHWFLVQDAAGDFVWRQDRSVPSDPTDSTAYVRLELNPASQLKFEHIWAVLQWNGAPVARGDMFRVGTASTMTLDLANSMSVYHCVGQCRAQLGQPVLNNTAHSYEFDIDFLPLKESFDAPPYNQGFKIVYNDTDSATPAQVFRAYV